MQLICVNYLIVFLLFPVRKHFAKLVRENFAKPVRENIAKWVRENVRENLRENVRENFVNKNVTSCCLFLRLNNHT